MKRVFTIISVLFLLSGCATTGGTGSRLWPWNWTHPDATARVERAEARTDKATDKAVHSAHVETRKAEIALVAATPTPETDVALRMLHNGNGLLAQVDPLTAVEESAAEKIVAGFLSLNVAQIAEAEKKQAAAEKAAAIVSVEYTRAVDAQKVTEEKLKVANTENAEQAEKYRRLWFWIYTIAGGWIAFQLLAGASRFVPALAPLSRVAGFLSSPVVQATYERTTSAVGKAIADAHKVSAEAGDYLRKFLDPHVDSADQVTIKSKVNSAS